MFLYFFVWFWIAPATYFKIRSIFFFKKMAEIWSNNLLVRVLYSQSRGAGFRHRALLMTRDYVMFCFLFYLGEIYCIFDLLIVALLTKMWIVKTSFFGLSVLVRICRGYCLREGLSFWGSLRDLNTL